MANAVVPPRTALLAGATGLIGRALLPMLLASKYYRSVHVLLRRTPPDIKASAKLKIHQVDFARLPAAFPTVGRAMSGTSYSTGRNPSTDRYRSPVS
jgi:nucleoside-diphosphate-sugar epimerase